MHSSAEIAILLNVAELAKRYGMRPSDADADLDFVSHTSSSEHWYFELSFDSIRQTSLEPYRKMAQALGCDRDGTLKTQTLAEMEDAVDRALSLAPRSRERR